MQKGRFHNEKPLALQDPGSKQQKWHSSHLTPSVPPSPQPGQQTAGGKTGPVDFSISRHLHTLHWQRTHLSQCCCWCCLAAESCPTLCDHMDYSPKDSSAHAISQVRILEWIAISFSRGSFQPRDQTCVSCIDRQIPYQWATWESSISPILIIILKISGSKPGIISPHKGRIGCVWRHSCCHNLGEGYSWHLLSRWHCSMSCRAQDSPYPIKKKKKYLAPNIQRAEAQESRIKALWIPMAVPERCRGPSPAEACELKTCWKVLHPRTLGRMTKEPGAQPLYRSRVGHKWQVRLSWCHGFNKGDLDRRAEECGKACGEGQGSSCCWNLGLTERNNAPRMPGMPWRQLSLRGGQAWATGIWRALVKMELSGCLGPPTQARQMTEG